MAIAPTTCTAATRLLALTGAVAAVGSVGLVVVLQVIEPAGDAVHGMISELVFGPAPWLFDTAVLLLVAGAVAVRAALTTAGLLSRYGGLLTVSAAAMTAIAVFPTCHCTAQVTTSGLVHAVASGVAFTSLPLAVLRLAARHTGSWARVAAWARRIARACLCCLAPMALIMAPFVLSVRIPLPFGLIQRAACLLVVALVLLLAAWAWSAAGRPHGPGGATDDHREVDLSVGGSALTSASRGPSRR